MPIMTHLGIEMIGKTVKDAVIDGRVHYEAIKAFADVIPLPECHWLISMHFTNILLSYDTYKIYQWYYGDRFQRQAYGLYLQSV
jgi:hypothetical protein